MTEQRVQTSEALRVGLVLALAGGYLDAYTYRVAKYVGSYAAAMNGVDAIAFTAGVGENDIEVFLAEGQPAQAGSQLVESAKAAGGFVNISVIVADILGDDPGTEETEPLAAAEESIQVFPGNAAGPAEDGALHEVTGPGESSEDMSEGDAPEAGGESE